MQGNRLAPKCRSDSVPVARSGILTRMGMRPLVALVAIMLVVSGCGAGGSPAPGASCQPGLVQAGETYRPATDAPPDLSAGEAVPNANLSSPFFGVVTGTLRTATPRQIQLGAKLTF